MKSKVYLFYNTLNGNLPKTSGSHENISVWLPKGAFVEMIVNHILTNSTGDIEGVFIEDVLDVKGDGLPTSFERFRIRHDTSQPKPKKTAFMAANDTIAKSFVPVIKSFREQFDLGVYTAPLTKENAGTAFDSNGIGHRRFSFKGLLRENVDVLILGNDWSREAKHIIAKCRKCGIKTICIQESIVDFGDLKAKRMKWADFAFVQGAQTVLELDREQYYLVGNPRYEDIKFTRLPEKDKTLINCNFTYGIYEEVREQWLADVVGSLEESGVEYFISQHPRDKGNLDKFSNVYRSNANVVHQQLKESSFVITRFSSLVHEALCMGRRVIYYNPHSESMQYDFGFDQNLLFYCKGRQELCDSVKSIRDSDVRTFEAHSLYLGKHCTLLNNKPSEVISRLLMQSDFRDGTGMAINLWRSRLGYIFQYFQLNSAIVRLILKLIKLMVGK